MNPPNLIYHRTQKQKVVNVQLQEAKYVLIDGQVMKLRAFVASTDIKPGEEIIWDYIYHKAIKKENDRKFHEFR